ncbi:metal ABC transporter permease [Rivihabitans pingtungensis]|jgi:zinc/manganese transport system permease protein|uniref:metal ABC transporter permease n=1 Tax=Rivihabitans pingtungensis TaxID=1054498 RepID=UPI0023529BD0|nr:metal ABC transporter permease [Rivihabitans pingtungensis]MCK6436098.1 metal ABC transporter permease [Rivihabitans pingtungensis]HNX70813.1 metal ABC transporter permease [Rivihabitans pingtungensis]
MNELYTLLVQPFIEFGFMRRGLVGCLALALGCGPIGLFLVMRRMSLMGDALSHAVLPGAAIGFIFAGLSLPAMGLGGFVAGISVALIAGLVSRFTSVREDASFAAFYLLALSVGVLLVSKYGSNVDLIHILFGTVLAVDDAALLLVASIASLTLLTLAVIYRPLLLESYDPAFLQSVGASGGAYHLIFLVLVVLNLVAGFQALGTLMAVGLMMLPAITARLWAQSVGGMLLTAITLALSSGLGGLLCSYHFDLPSGPAIILFAGSLYLLSLLFAPAGGVLPRLIRQRHLAH